LGGSIKPAKSLKGSVYFFGSMLALPVVSMEDCDVDCCSKCIWLKLSSRRYSAISYGLLTSNECRRDLRYPWIGFDRLGVMPSLLLARNRLPGSLWLTGTEMVDPMKFILLSCWLAVVKSFDKNDNFFMVSHLFVNNKTISYVQ
jgi:hypothetical protein